MVKSIVFASAFIFSGLVSGTEIVYTPTSPSFGGNALNGSFLLSQAQAQKEFTKKSTNDNVNRFEDRLQNAVLSQLSRRVLEQAFGDLEAGFGAGGTFVSGDFEVQIITSNPDVIEIQITNILTGEITILQIPIFGG